MSVRSPHHFESSIALLAAMAGVLLFSSPRMASAQDNATLRAEQTASIAYGESISFTIHGSNAEPVSDVLLHIHVLNRPDSDAKPQTFSGGSSFSASVTVPVAALQLPPFAQITYNWEIWNESGSASQTDTQTLLYEDTTLPWAWVVKSRDNVFVHWDGREQSVADVTLANAASASEKLADLTGVRPAGAIHVYVYPELSALAGSLRRNQQRVQDWVAAYSVPDQGGIFIASDAAPDALPNLNRDLAHELTHVFVFEAASQHPSAVPGWLNEGLALSSAPDPDTSLNAGLNEAVHDGVLLSLNDLCVPTFGPLPPRDSALAYAQSQSFVSYILARYGASQIRALLAVYAGGASCTDGVRLVLGVPLADLESQWHAELGRSYEGQTLEEVSLLPWVIAWCISLALALLFLAPQAPVTEDRPAFLTRRSVPPVSDISQE